MRILTLSIAILLCGMSTVRAQRQDLELIRGNDTLAYTYVPFDPSEMERSAAPSESAAVKRGFFHRIIDYFDRANEDRTFEKKIDFSIIGGPSYSSTTKLGLGLMAVGLYRTDRTDSLTPPSNVSIFAAGSITGFYSVGIRGNTIFRHDLNRLNYKLQFYSEPSEFWGVGYYAGAHHESDNFLENKASVDLRWTHRIARNLYAGAMVNFAYVTGSKFDDDKRSYLLDPSYPAAAVRYMNTEYVNTGIGLLAEYDTRDFQTNAYRGLYLSLDGTIFPKALNTCGGYTLWRVEFTAASYHRVWRDGIVAVELRGEFNSAHTPWPFMARMGGDIRMRGYYEGRYTDLDMMVAQVELRQRIWRRIGAVVWAGAGNVFPRFSEFRWSQTLPNYGVGLRWEFNNRENIRVDYGFGRRTSGLVLQINEAF